MSTPGDDGQTLKKTPLHSLHVAAGAKMVPFAGHEMPVHYALGVLKEHLHTREKAGLFDVSHMGQIFLIPRDGQYETAARALEALAPGDFLSLKPGRQRYSQFLDSTGGIVDDFMATRPGLKGHEHELYLVINAARKQADLDLLARNLPENVELKADDSLALIALQGPQAAGVLARLAPEVTDMAFMTSLDLKLNGADMHVSRAGYTGEDGFELSMKNEHAAALWQVLAAEAEVEPAGLGARDSLRLEAGLCLYGHDIDETTSPVEAGLSWSIGKRRRREGGFPGAARILKELENGPARHLVGIRPEGRAPAREGTRIFSPDGEEIGRVTSGGYGPTVGGPVAMGYVKTGFHTPDTALELEVRGKYLPARTAKMPFVPHRYHRKKKSA